mmetsp:Transcript_22384/g.76695  ORF Transcript_22384/g.76695 Transcript_22384/m.76695 type:complete len:309 (+) Transcript_22384:1462-2388(+)
MREKQLYSTLCDAKAALRGQSLAKPLTGRSQHVAHVLVGCCRSQGDLAVVATQHVAAPSDLGATLVATCLYRRLPTIADRVSVAVRALVPCRGVRDDTLSREQSEGIFRHRGQERLSHLPWSLQKLLKGRQQWLVRGREARRPERDCGVQRVRGAAGAGGARGGTRGDGHVGQSLAYSVVPRSEPLLRLLRTMACGRIECQGSRGSTQGATFGRLCGPVDQCLASLSVRCPQHREHIQAFRLQHLPWHSPLGHARHGQDRIEADVTHEGHGEVAAGPGAVALTHFLHRSKGVLHSTRVLASFLNRLTL